MKTAIDELKPNSASGPDGFPVIMLKNCKLHLAAPLPILWRSCFNSGDIPSLLKKGLIIPQHKGGKWSLPAIY